jgi:hypothetical protein
MSFVCLVGRVIVIVQLESRVDGSYLVVDSLC